MSTVTFHRFMALLGYVSCLAAAPAMAQMGPIQPVMVTDGKVEYSHDRPDIGDFTVPVEVHVDASGAIHRVVVSESTGNALADELAVTFMKQRKFLPGLDDRGVAVDSVVRVTVNMYKRGSRKVARVTVKPPPMAQETLRVQTLMCADFLWEIERMDKEAGIDDLSLESCPTLPRACICSRSTCRTPSRRSSGRVAECAQEGRRSLRTRPDAHVLQ
jgi:TonB family protein